MKAIFLKILKSERRKLTKQEYKTLRGQALAGDVDGAIKGLDKCLTRYLRKIVEERNNTNDR
jgi:hypothetical protein